MSLSFVTLARKRVSQNLAEQQQRRHMFLSGDGDIDDNKMTRCKMCMFDFFIWFYRSNTIGVESCRMQTAQTSKVIVSRFVEAMASEWYGRLCSCTVLRYFMIFLPFSTRALDFQ